jgi:hypothetical protein
MKDQMKKSPQEEVADMWAKAGHEAEKTHNKSENIYIPKQAKLWGLLDASGSMAYEIDNTRDGFNFFLTTIRSMVGVPVYVSASIFETSTHAPALLDIPITEPSCILTREAYFDALGGTALYDAIGDTIERLDVRANDDYLKIVVVQTDGGENSSTHKKWKQGDVLAQEIAKLRQQGWQFLFLGTGSNIYDVAARLQVDPNLALSYSAKRGNAAFHTAGKIIGSVINTGVEGAFTNEQRRALGDVFHQNAKLPPSDVKRLGKPEDSQLRRLLK